MNINFNSYTINFNENILNNNEIFLNGFLNYSNKLDINFFLNCNKNNFSFIEKLIYDTMIFHCKMYNIDINDKYISFWSKSKQYNIDYINMHTDHCDYEYQIFNKQDIKPIFTTLIYLNDDKTPTIITDITDEMFKNNDFTKNNNKLLFSFPKKFKNIAFDSNKFHAESYLSKQYSDNRKVIVIALWDKLNKPYYIPFFDNSIFNYFMFSNYNIPINEDSFFNKNTPIIDFINNNDNIISIKTNDKTLINNQFFYDLIINQKKDILYKFNSIIMKIKNVDNIIINFDSDLLN